MDQQSADLEGGGLMLLRLDLQETPNQQNTLWSEHTVTTK